MSRKTRTTLTVVEKLIEQRRLFQDWLTKLAGEVDGMPPHVVERVKNDYRARFDGVMRELGEHRDALREALEESQQHHDSLDAQAQARKDELAELKLRRQVGEIDEIRFKEQSGMMKNVLDGLQKEIASASRDIERYEEILDVIASDERPAAPAPPAPAAREGEEPEEDDEDEYEDEEEEEEEEPVRPAAPARAVAPAPPPPPRQSPEPAPRPAPDAAPKKPSEDELAFLRSMTPPSGIRPVSAPPRPSPPAPPARKEAPAPTLGASAAEEPESVFDAAPGLVHLPPSEFDDPEPAAAAAAPARKDEEGLVCGECGALNRPTEWYCEKCGAELAAI